MMLTENPTPLYQIKVNNQVIGTNIPSRAIAESMIAALPAAQRAIAEIEMTTSTGKVVLFG